MRAAQPGFVRRGLPFHRNAQVGGAPGVPGVLETPVTEADNLRHEMVEILKTLNWGEEEVPDMRGIEASEILARLKRGSCPLITETLLGEAIETLLANRMAQSTDRIEYAWERGRLVGLRYTITVLGKQYLIRQLEKDGRIP